MPIFKGLAISFSSSVLQDSNFGIGFFLFPPLKLNLILLDRLISVETRLGTFT
jgi:hypothetical protein